MDNQEQVNYIRTMSEPLGYLHTIRLDRDLTTPSDFHEELTVIRTASKDDVIKIILNGSGGSDTVMKAFLSSIAQFEGHCITEIEGDCCSALTPIFLAGDELMVSDDAVFMIHTQSFGYSGKENNVRQFVDFNTKANEKLMRKYYRHYLSQEEITKIINGKDVWHGADEILERLENRAKLFEQERSDTQQVEPSGAEGTEKYWIDRDGFVFDQQGGLLFTRNNNPIQIASNFKSAKEIKEVADFFAVKYNTNASKKKVAELLHTFFNN